MVLTFTTFPSAVLDRTFERVRRWPVDSQQKARRNAMIACTALAQRRAEREDVAEFLATLARPVQVARAAHA